jgi:hypothetical protein
LEHDLHRKHDRLLPRTSQWREPIQLDQDTSLESQIPIQFSQQEAQSSILDYETNQILKDRAQKLITILKINDPEILSRQLETFLETLSSSLSSSSSPIQDSDRIPMSLEMPLILALIQNRSNRSDKISRKKMFCPF